MSEGKQLSPGAKRNSVPWDEVDRITSGIERHSKASFLVIGHRTGTRLAVPKTTTGVSRAYFYGSYEQVPALPGIRTYTPDERREQHLGGIIAKVDFGSDIGEALAALSALIEVVRNSPAPAPKGERKPRVPKAPKAPKAPKPTPDAGSDSGDDDEEGITAGRPR